MVAVSALRKGKDSEHKAGLALDVEIMVLTESLVKGRWTMVEKSRIESVKEEIVGAIKGTGDIVNAVVDTVAGTLTNTIKGTGAVATSLIGALSDTARASIQGVAQVGGDIGVAPRELS